MKRIIILFSVVFGLALLWTVVWFFVAGRIGSEVTKLAAPEPGIPAVSCGTFSVAGFPFRFDVTCGDITVENGDQTLELAEIKATALVYRPTHFIAFAQGPLVIRDAFFGSHQQLEWALLEASLRLNGFSLTRLSAVADNLRFTDRLLGETLIAESPHVEFHLIDTPQDETAPDNSATIGLFARAQAATIPGFAISDTELTVEAEADRLPADIRDWQRPDLLRQWQAAGGTLRLHRLEAVEPDADLSLSGALTLNESGEAEGDLTLVSNGLGPRLNLFLVPEVRDVFIGNPQPDGSHKQIFTVRRGAILAGLTPAGAIPPLF